MRKLAVALALLSFNASSHTMGPTIKKYVVEEVSNHDVILGNSHKATTCYDVTVDGKPHFNPKVCLAYKEKKKIKVFVSTPPNEKSVTRVCTEPSERVTRKQRYQLCTDIVTYFPEKQLHSALQ